MKSSENITARQIIIYFYTVTPPIGFITFGSGEFIFTHHQLHGYSLRGMYSKKNEVGLARAKPT
jgi:hypothetical protein